MKGVSFTGYSFLMGILGGPIALCVGILFYFRKEHQLKVREPAHAIVMGLLDVASIAALYFRRSGSMGCAPILWSGHILLNLTTVISVLRVWTIKVKSDRTLRNKFHSKTRNKFQFQVILGALLYTCSLILILKYAHRSRHSTLNECYFLFPLSCAIPFAAALIVARSLMAYEISKYANKNRDTSPDHLGVSNELFWSSLLSTMIGLVYFPYVTHCSWSESNNRYIVADSLFVMMPFANGLLAVIVPTIRTLISVKLRAVEKNQNIVVRPRSLKVLCSSKTRSKYSCPKSVHEILQDNQQASMFRNFAQKMLCAESVDFCLEVIEYQNSISKTQEKGFLSDHFDTEALYQRYYAILEEFVLNNSPCEVNISGTQKASLLKYKTLEAFKMLSPDELAVLFDPAVDEIEKLLHDNLLSLFTKNAKIPSRYVLSSRKDDNKK